LGFCAFLTYLAVERGASAALLIDFRAEHDFTVLAAVEKRGLLSAR